LVNEATGIFSGWAALTDAVIFDHYEVISGHVCRGADGAGVCATVNEIRMPTLEDI
jgi:hypothetical protein